MVMVGDLSGISETPLQMHKLTGINCKNDPHHFKNHKHHSVKS